MVEKKGWTQWKKEDVVFFLLSFLLSSGLLAYQTRSIVILQFAIPSLSSRSCGQCPLFSLLLSRTFTAKPLSCRLCGVLILHCREKG